MFHFRQLKSVWSGLSGDRATSVAPKHIAPQLLELACKEHQLESFLSELCEVPLPRESIDLMLAECLSQRDPALLARVEDVMRKQGAGASASSYALLIRGNSGDLGKARALLEEALSAGVAGGSPELVLAALEFCQRTGEVALADRVY